MNARPWFLLTALASMPLLAGCDVDARVTVAADDTVTVDVTAWGTWSSTDEFGTDTIDTVDPCAHGLSPQAPLQRTILRDPADKHHLGCRLTGNATLEEFAAMSGNTWLVHRDGRYQLLVPGPQLMQVDLDTSTDPQKPQSLGRFHAEVTFPGEVTFHDPSAKVAGRTVVWDDRSAQDLGGAWATSREEGQLATGTVAQLAALAGVAVGAVGTFVVWLLRGPRRRDAAASEVASAEATDNSSVWAPPPDPDEPVA